MVHGCAIYKRGSVLELEYAVPKLRNLPIACPKHSLCDDHVWPQEHGWNFYFNPDSCHAIPTDELRDYKLTQPALHSRTPVNQYFLAHHVNNGCRCCRKFNQKLVWRWFKIMMTKFGFLWTKLLSFNFLVDIVTCLLPQTFLGALKQLWYRIKISWRRHVGADN